MRILRISVLALLASVLCTTGCGYHQVRTASHIPAGIHTVAVPIFENRTQLPRIELWMTQAIIRQLAVRTELQILPEASATADATLKGIILAESATPLTYSSNDTTTTTSSYVITVVAKVVLTDAHGQVLFENDNYSFREVFQSTRQNTAFIQEDSPALERLAKQFAATLVGDMLESF